MTVRWIDEGNGSLGAAPYQYETWEFRIFDAEGYLWYQDPNPQQLLHSAGIAVLKDMYAKHAAMQGAYHPAISKVCAVYTTYYGAGARLCASSTGVHTETTKATWEGTKGCRNGLAPQPNGSCQYTPQLPTPMPSTPRLYQTPSLNVALAIPVSVLPPTRPVRWIGETPGRLGALDSAQNAQAKALLASWNSTDGNSCISGYGLDPADVNPLTWGNRDGWALSCFVNWWNVNHKFPALPPPGTQNGVGWVDLTQAHLAALQQWGVSKGVLNPGQVPCAVNCQAKYWSDPVNLAKCLAICGSAGQPTLPPPPAPTQNCPGNMFWDTAGQTCKCPAGTTWNAAATLCQAPSTACPTGMVWDGTSQSCQPLPPPPPPTTTPTTTTTGTSSGTGLLVIGAVVLAAVGIFAAVVSGGGGAVGRAAPRSNPRKKKSRKKNPGPTYSQGAAPIANACDYDWTDELYYFSLGAYGSTHVYVWANSADDAMEEMVEWVDDNAPGLLSTIGEAELRESAEELGIEYDPEDVDYQIIEHAEQDMYVVGHTTLKHGNAMPSWEIHFNEVTGKKKEAVKRLSEIECLDEGPLPLPAGN